MQEPGFRIWYLDFIRGCPGASGASGGVRGRPEILNQKILNA